MAPKRNNKPSVVWNFFIKEKQYARCKLCPKTLKLCGNTTNLANHLQAFHANTWTKKKANTDTDTDGVGGAEREMELETLMYNEIEDASSTTSSHSHGHYSPSTSSSAASTASLESCFAKINSFKGDGDKAKACTRALISWLIVDNLPAYIVSSSAFRNYIKILNPHITIPDRKTIRRKTDEMFNIGARFIKGKLTETDNIALTMDIWTDSLNNRSYLGVTAHTIEEFECKSYILANKHLTDSHTAVNLAAHFQEVLGFWEIEKDKIVCCVTDNAANITCACNLFFGQDKHIGCFAHSLNLVVTNAIESVTEFANVVKKVKDIVSFFNRSNIASAALEKHESLKLKQSIETRWNSTYIMLERFLAIKESVSLVLLNLDGPPDISYLEKKMLEDALKVLKPFFQVTEEMSSEKNATLSKVIPILTLLSKALTLSVQNISCNHIKKLKSTLVVGLNTRFANVEQNLLYSCATVLDPRFKNLDFSSAPCCARVLKFISGEIQNLQPRPSTSLKTQTLVPDVNDIWSLRNQSKIHNSTNVTTGLSMSVKTYSESPPVDHKCDPLKIWAACANYSPALATLAKKYLCIPATSVPAERLFSKAGNTITTKRSSLNPKRVEKLLILSSLSFEKLCTM